MGPVGCLPRIAPATTLPSKAYLLALVMASEGVGKYKPTSASQPSPRAGTQVISPQDITAWLMCAELPGTIKWT